MKSVQPVVAFVMVLIFLISMSTFQSYAISLSETSHEAPLTVHTIEGEDESSAPPSSRPSSSKKPESSKPPSSNNPSSSKTPSSRPVSSRPTSSKPTSSKIVSSKSSSKPNTKSSYPVNNQSTNSYLFSLRVVNRKNESIIYPLSPVFSKDTLNYSVSVPEDVTGVALYGVPEDSVNAHVEYRNKKTLAENSVTKLSVICVAGNGERRTYVILVSRGNVPSSGDYSSAPVTSDTSDNISLPPVIIQNISSFSPFSSSFASNTGSNRLLGIFAWIFLLVGFAMVVFVILNSSPTKKSIGSTTVGAYTPNTRQNRMKKNNRRKAKKRLLNPSYYSKYSRYKH